MGHIETIHVAPTARAPMQPVASVMLEAGRGVRGDRYAAKNGTFSDNPRDHELTLVEAEVVIELGFAPGESRRNLTTRDVRLNELVGKRFRIGAALCEGTRLCEPCAHLERLTERWGLARTMAGRGGLRAVILEGAEIRVGDPITAEVTE